MLLTPMSCELISQLATTSDLVKLVKYSENRNSAMDLFVPLIQSSAILVP